MTEHGRFGLMRQLWGQWRVQLGAWPGRITSTVLDQAALSGSHFLYHLVLARKLAEAEYGVFALGYASLWLLSLVYSALVLEPLAVFAPRLDVGSTGEYFAKVWRLHWLVSGALGLALLAIGAVLRLAGREDCNGLLWGALALPGVLGVWLCRYESYSQAAPWRALRTSGLYAGVLTATLALLLVWRVGAQGSLAGMGAAGVLVCGLRAARRSMEKVAERASAREPQSTLDVWKRHWEWGQWRLLAAGLQAAGSGIYVPCLAAVQGVQAVAVYRAAENLMLPLGQTLTALSLLWVPHMAARYPEGGISYLRRATRKASLFAMALALAYGVVMVVSAGWLVPLMYGAGRYQGLNATLPWLWVALMLRAIDDTGLGSALRAANRPDLLLWPMSASALASVSAGVVLTGEFGAAGAAAGLATSSAAGALAAASVLSRKLWRKPVERRCLSHLSKPARTTSTSLS